MKNAVVNLWEETPKLSQRKSNKKSSSSKPKASKTTNKIQTNSNSGATTSVDYKRTKSTKAELPNLTQTINDANISHNANISTTMRANTNGLPHLESSYETYNTEGTALPANSQSIKVENNSSSSKPRRKLYAGFEGRSVRAIWEQQDQSEFELSDQVCERIAEDVSYKIWELISQIKTYARHSGGRVTTDLVNEVLCDHDIPPALGAMDSEWERIECDGAFYFPSDKVLELRDEYQKEVTITMPTGPDFQCAWPLESKSTELLKTYIPNLIYAGVNGDTDAFDMILKEVAFSPIIGAAFRMFLAKLIQILAFKQNDALSQRVWRLLRASSSNQYSRDIVCREEYFHLAEILVCQLLGTNAKHRDTETSSENINLVNNIKIDLDDIKVENIQMEHNERQTQSNPECNYKLLQDDEVEKENNQVKSPYFATPVADNCIWELCECLGQLASISAYFQNESMLHILQRLDTLCAVHELTTEKEFNYLSRAVRGLIALGEYAFREIIPYLHKIPVDNVPEYLWNDFATAAVYLRGPDDIFLYEWLEYVCGADKLQPFMSYYAQYHAKLLMHKQQHRKAQTYHISPKIGVRRLEWNPLAIRSNQLRLQQMPQMAARPKPTILDYFPEMVAPQVQRRRIRLRVAGARTVLKTAAATFRDPPQLKSPRTSRQLLRQRSLSVASPTPIPPSLLFSTAGALGGGLINTYQAPLPAAFQAATRPIAIARRRLLKPLTNKPRFLNISEYHLLTL